MKPRRIHWRRKNKKIIAEGISKGKTIYLFTLPNPEKLLFIFPEEKQEKIKKRIDSLDIKKKKSLRERNNNRKEYLKEYHSRPEFKERKKIMNKEATLKRRQFLKDYKKNKSCEKCGYNEHTEILQFHHKDNKEKIMSEIRTIKKIQEEIKKCSLLCPNCHFFLHYNQSEISRNLEVA